MASKRLINYVLAAFVAGTLALVYIQYNSSKNINRLIDGNKRLLREVDVVNQLKDLEKQVVLMDIRVDGSKESGSWNDREVVIRTMLQQLQQVPDTGRNRSYLQELSELIERKLVLTAQWHLAPEHTLEEEINYLQTSRALTDAVSSIVQQVDSSRQRLLEEATESIDRSGVNALRMGTILIVIVLISAALLFWYIINRIQAQQRLIAALNESEQRVRESARIKENFLANMSHEIRTPLNAILGFTKLLERQPLDARSREYTGTIQQSGENLLAIINDILDISRLESGSVQLEKSAFRIRKLTESVRQMFLPTSQASGIELRIQVGPEVPELLLGDVTRLTQILVNLVGNALKFTEKGTVILEVRSRGRQNEQEQLQLSVTDTGIGIEPEQLPHIFDRFQQAESSITRKYGGTGLGLAIVRELVQIHGGRMEVSSQPGIGTRFDVFIPFDLPSSKEMMSTTASADTELPKIDYAGVGKILVAEDNDINRQLLRHLFQLWGLEVDFAGNGQEAIDQLKRSEYALMLMDVQMPVMDGYTATRMIRDQLQLSIPIIAMTAHVLPGEKERCLAAGMNGYLSKPIREHNLREMLHPFLQNGTVSPELPADKREASNYQRIRLHYMHEISGGDRTYEREVTREFLDSIPNDLQAIRQCWDGGQLETVRRTAHNMRTSISIFELNDTLNPLLLQLEQEAVEETDFERIYSALQSICGEALLEAEDFYRSL